MFDAIKALRPLDGTTWATGTALRDSLGEVTFAHRQVLPSGFSRRDLVELVQQNRWIRKTEDGQIQLVLPKDES